MKDMEDMKTALTWRPGFAGRGVWETRDRQDLECIS